VADREADASGAVDGVIDGERKFHTAEEWQPWWQVDLRQPLKITQIRIYNTSDHTAFRFRRFTVAVSSNQRDWVEIARKADDTEVGGIDGKFFVWRAELPTVGQYVRITLSGTGFLHLAQVQVFSRDPELTRSIAISPAGPENQLNPAGDVTVVLTSCGRHDLLDRTLTSFHAFNTYAGVKEILVVEDGAADPQDVCEKHRARLIRIGQRKGQMHAIDVAYLQVTTPYIFHCEDDWEFYRADFIQDSMKILAVDLSCVSVWLRAWNDTNTHPLSFRSACRNFGVLEVDYLGRWHGFTFNPGLRRKSDYEVAGPFSEVFNKRQDLWEDMVGAVYRALGYRGVILQEAGYVRHIGGDRHQHDPRWEFRVETP
jgi:hypothetical protein